MTKKLNKILARHAGTACLEGEGDDRALDAPVPTRAARDLCADLRAVGIEASWAPDHDDRSQAWVYVRG